MSQAQPFKSQPYPGHTYQVPVQPQPSMVHPGYHGGIPIPTTQAILGYHVYPPPRAGLSLQGYQTLP